MERCQFATVARAAGKKIRNDVWRLKSLPRYFTRERSPTHDTMAYIFYTASDVPVHLQHLRRHNCHLFHWFAASVWDELVIAGPSVYPERLSEALRMEMRVESLRRAERDEPKVSPRPCTT